MRLPLPRLFLAAVPVTAWAGRAYAGTSSPDVPSKVVPPAGSKVFLVAHAEGVQIYQCDTTTGVGVEVDPSADYYFWKKDAA